MCQLVVLGDGDESLRRRGDGPQGALKTFMAVTAPDRPNQAGGEELSIDLRWRPPTAAELLRLEQRSLGHFGKKRSGGAAIAMAGTMRASLTR